MPPTMEEGACNLRPIGPRGIFTCMHCKPLDTNRWYIQHIHQLAMLYNYCNMYYDLAITFVMTCICKSVFSLEKRLSTHNNFPTLLTGVHCMLSVIISPYLTSLLSLNKCSIHKFCLM